MTMDCHFKTMDDHLVRVHQTVEVDFLSPSQEPPRLLPVVKQQPQPQSIPNQTSIGNNDNLQSMLIVSAGGSTFICTPVEEPTKVSDADLAAVEDIVPDNPNKTRDETEDFDVNIFFDFTLVTGNPECAAVCRLCKAVLTLRQNLFNHLRQSHNVQSWDDVLTNNNVINHANAHNFFYDDGDEFIGDGNLEKILKCKVCQKKIRARKICLKKHIDSKFRKRRTINQPTASQLRVNELLKTFTVNSANNYQCNRCGIELTRTVKVNLKHRCVGTETVTSVNSDQPNGDRADAQSECSLMVGNCSTTLHPAAILDEYNLLEMVNTIKDERDSDTIEFKQPPVTDGASNSACNSAIDYIADAAIDIIDVVKMEQIEEVENGSRSNAVIPQTNIIGNALADASDGTNCVSAKTMFVGFATNIEQSDFVNEPENVSIQFHVHQNCLRL